MSPDDAILVHDRNGNGLVDGVAELFGSATVDGFDVLGLIDSNGDGKIDSGDQKFAELRVWRDADSDGQVDAGEMQTLAQAGLNSISLNRTDVNGQNQGHNRGFESTMTKADGSKAKAAFDKRAGFLHQKMEQQALRWKIAA